MKDSPLKCEIVDGKLVISVGTETLIDAIQNDWSASIVNTDNFLKDFIRAITSPDTNQETLITKLFTDAANNSFIEEEKKEEDEWWIVKNEN